MPLQIPHPDAPLHLYRHLLREASYLPAMCRPWVTERIRMRFRDPTRRKAKEPKRYVQEAHKDLRYLRVANAGHVDRMLRICYMATGRIGKRRRELAAALLANEPPVDTEMLESSMTNYASPDDSKDSRKERMLYTTEKRSSKHNVTVDTAESERGGADWLDNWSTEKIKALAGSQFVRQNSDWPYQVRRVFDPRGALPEYNCWGNPFKPKTARRKLQNHWKSVLKNLMVPVPQGEWDLLRDLAMGKAEENMWKIPSRRPVAASRQRIGKKGPAAKMEPSWEWEKYATQPIRAIEAENSRSRRSLCGGVDEDPRGQRHPIGIRAWKPRFLKRRIYSKVFNVTPLLKKTKKDIPTILDMIRELADYENELDAVEATPEKLQSTIAFAPEGVVSTSTACSTESTSPMKPARCLILFNEKDQPAGMGLYFYNYSTWRAKAGVYLEDLYVKVAERKKGYGKKLLVELAKEVQAMDGGRLEWSVLKWNEPSIKFYESIGAQAMDEWVGMRVDREGLTKLAGLLD